MKLVHSFTSKKCKDEWFKIQMWYFVLSCLYAKESGFNIVLHTDDKTANVLEICPYDNILTDLESVYCPADSKIWAWSKFEAMKNEPLGDVHIDGDVFLKDKCLIDALNFDNYDLIVQNLETPTWTGSTQEDFDFIKNNWQYNLKAFKNCTFPEWHQKNVDSMYNCGLVGFNNQKLKDDYYKAYWDMVYQYAKHGCSTNGVPDLIIEQQFLKNLSDFDNYKVKTLLDYNNIQLDAQRLGYQHVLGNGKEVYLETVKKIIKKHNFNIYNKMTNIWKD